MRGDGQAKQNKQVRQYFKCSDQTRGVFQWLDVASSVEAKELYEKSTVVKPVLAASVRTNGDDMSSSPIPCKVVEKVETLNTPGSAAELSIDTTKS
ncbi:LOW QUALITY PROTEIN: hypothetical protein PHMEG_0004557 [Phytophthora megakarya]|uniref:Uncharacterized protein n=1 Tax=Phytophthora megakarya TaxID=4795 RepID=A0A225WTJ8_9STRA|nr:LOW QUALITY PROTEIN: hypothetical protein PHMEG_0004557 [Phytophthora megakarya]